MSWQGYVDNLMADGNCLDSAVVGFASNKGVWAAHCGGCLASITEKEIDALVSLNRDPLFSNGLTLGGKKCSVIRDNLLIDGEGTLDTRTKCQGGETTTYCISIAKSLQTLVCVMGKEGVHGGKLNKKAFDMAEYLKKAGY